MKKILLLLLVVSSGVVHPQFRHHTHISEEIKKVEHDIQEYMHNPTRILDALEDELEGTTDSELSTKWEAFKEAFRKWLDQFFCCTKEQ